MGVPWTGAMDAAWTGPEADNVAALHSYHRAKEPCFTCGERWGREHRYPTNVPLHVVEELLQMLSTRDMESMQDGGCLGGNAENCAVISCHAVNGTESSRAAQLHGWLGCKEVLLLMDSASSWSFIRQDLVGAL